MPWKEITHIDQLRVGDVIKHHYKPVVRYGRVFRLFKGLRGKYNWVQGPFSSNLEDILLERKVSLNTLDIYGDQNMIFKLVKKTPYEDPDYANLWI